MRDISPRLMWIVVFMAMIGMASPPAYAQGIAGTSSSLAGLVVDTSGGVIPGVDVVIKNNATALETRTVTDGSGRFSVPALPPGTYTVTVSLMGFKTVVLPDVQLITATPSSVKAVLEVGTLEETVIVTGATELVQTQTAAVTTTIQVQQIQSLPVITHTALDYVIALPGVNTPGAATRSATIGGLPRAAMNITLDGINVQDKRYDSEGFFMFIRPMMDSIEEISVSTSTPEAVSTGAGGATIRMETRAGSNRFSGSVYDTWRNQAGTNDKDVLDRKESRGWLWRLNTPYWFNKRDLPKTAAGDYFINDVRLTTPGFRVGGPIVRDKLFYFFNYEEFRLPESRQRQWNVLTTSAMVGDFTYPASDGSGNKSVNLLAIAAANGQTSTMDPAISKLLGEIRSAVDSAGSSGSVTPLNTLVDRFNYNPTATQLRRFPTLRVDYNLASAHRVTFTFRFNDFNSNPDLLNTTEARFPGFKSSGGQVSGRYMWQATERATIGKNIVNEVRIGAQNATGGGNNFYSENSAELYNCADVGCQQAGGQGWNFVFPSVGGYTLTGATPRVSYKTTEVAAQFSVEDTLTWLRGRHNISAGVSFSRINERSLTEGYTAGDLSFGTSSYDTVAYNMLDRLSGNFPGGITDTYAGYARNLYGFLTGRVTQLAGSYYLQPSGSYNFNGVRTLQTTADDIGAFVSDSWRARPNLTLSYGLRWQVQLPMTTSDVYAKLQSWDMIYGMTGAGSGKYGQGNLYQGGRVATGKDPVLERYPEGEPAWNTDWNNLSPSFGVTWRPNVRSPLLSRILSTDPVFRGGYSITYTKHGTVMFDTAYPYNPGRTRSGTRAATSGSPTLGAAGWPVLLRDTARLTPSTAPASLSGDWTLTPALNEQINTHYPDWPVPQTHQYSAGFARDLGKSMAIEIRYVGNTHMGGWQSWNLNTTGQYSMLSGENGFYDEFRKAQANLAANVAAGLSPTFAYTGQPGTSPLPIFMAYFQGIPLNDARNQAPANYTASQFRSSSYYNSLSMYNPALGTITGTGSSGLQAGIGTGTGLDANRIAAGLPANFFTTNPAIGQAGAYLYTGAGNTRFNSIQIDLRRRMANGLLIQANYQYAFGLKDWVQRTLREDWFYVNGTGGPDHSLKLNWVWELPFGQGKAFGSNVGPWMDRVIGGWEIDGIARIQTGSKFNFGNYRLVGMTEKEFADMFKFYDVVEDGKTYTYMFPQDVIEQSIIAIYNTSATTTSGYSGTPPSGRYIAPASGPDCVSYWDGMCPGTLVRRIVTGPKFWKVDMSFVKRIAVVKNTRIEARMDLFNVFDTINFNATSGMGSSKSSWRVTSAATDASSSQDPGGRITQFGLRFTW